MMLFLVVAAITSFLLYGHALQAPFYLDDFVVLTGAETLHMGTRPLGFASFWLSHRLAEWLALVFPFGDTFYYRLPNVLIHMLAATAVFWLARELSGRRLTAGIAGGLFLIHPIQTQAIVYVSQRFESLSALFMFLSAACYVRFRKGAPRLWLWLTILSAIAAAVTKETALALPLWLFLIEIIFFSGMPSLRSLAYWLPVIALMVYPSYLTVLSSAGTFIWIPFEFYLLTQGDVLLRYLKLIILPGKQFLLYDIPAVTSLSLDIAAKWAVLLAIVVAGIYLARRRPIVGFGILTFFILLLPTSVMPLPDLMFEHRVYPALAGIAIAIAGAVRPTRATAAVFCVLFLFLGYRTYVRNGEWNDRVAFFEAHREQFPEDPKSLASLGTAYTTRGEIRKAIEVNLQARRYLPRLNAYYYKSVSLVVDLNLAQLYASAGDKPRVKEEALRVLATDPGQMQALQILGGAQFEMNDIDGARSTYEKLVMLNPSNTFALKELANAYDRLGEYDKAEQTRSKLPEPVKPVPPSPVPTPEENHPQLKLYQSKVYQRAMLFGSILGAMLLALIMIRILIFELRPVWTWVLTGKLSRSTVSVEPPAPHLRN